MTSSPVSTPANATSPLTHPAKDLVPVEQANGSYAFQQLNLSLSTSWEIDYWTNPLGSQLPTGMAGTFTAVPNPISEYSGGGWTVIYEPLNVAYGTDDNFVWFQLCVYFTNDYLLYMLAYSTIIDHQFNLQYLTADTFNTTTGQPIPYIPGDTYSYSIGPSSSNTVTFNLEDVTSNSSFSKAYTVPAATLLYEKYAYSPASCVETYFYPNVPFINVPTFTTTIQNQGETTYSYTPINTDVPVPQGIGDIVSGIQGSYIWSMVASVHQDEAGTYVPAGSIDLMWQEIQRLNA
jgi:hypothetical protein